jgi:hypothetical protein
MPIDIRDKMVEMNIDVLKDKIVGVITYIIDDEEYDYIKNYSLDKSLIMVVLDLEYNMNKAILEAKEKK